MGGMEWNVPPWGGDEHATIFVPASKERLLTEFKASFDDYGRDKHDAALAVAGLQWLAAQGRRTAREARSLPTNTRAARTRRAWRTS